MLQRLQQGLLIVLKNSEWLTRVYANVQSFTYWRIYWIQEENIK